MRFSDKISFIINILWELWVPLPPGAFRNETEHIVVAGGSSEECRSFCQCGI